MFLAVNSAVRKNGSQNTAQINNVCIQSTINFDIIHTIAIGNHNLLLGILCFSQKQL